MRVERVARRGGLRGRGLPGDTRGAGHLNDTGRALRTGDSTGPSEREGPDQARGSG
jgi:hypothetical protein